MIMIFFIFFKKKVSSLSVPIKRTVRPGPEWNPSLDPVLCNVTESAGRKMQYGVAFLNFGFIRSVQP